MAQISNMTMMFSATNMWTWTSEHLLSGLGDNKGADQSVHQGSLISTFVICLMESVTSKLATSEMAIFKVVSVAEQADLGMTWLETLKTGFLMLRPMS